MLFLGSGVVRQASATTNLIPNGSFESAGSYSFAGWGMSASTNAAASDAESGLWATKIRPSGSGSYGIFVKPQPVSSATAGSRYGASVWIRSETPGKTVCVNLREVTASGSLAQPAVKACAFAQATWSQLTTATMTVVSTGDAVGLTVNQPTANSTDSFEADNAALTEFTTQDTTAPSTPTGLSSTGQTSSSISLTWNAASDPDDASSTLSYKISRNGNQVGTTTGGQTTFTDTGLNASTTYTYTVTAVDQAGNASGASTPISVPTTGAGATIAGLWHLDETGGTTAFDSSGAGNDGAISGSVALGLPGVAGTAYKLTQGAVIIPDNAGLRPLTANVTVSYWMNTTNAPPAHNDYDVFVKGSSTSSGGQIKLEIQPNGQASCMFRGSLGQKQIQHGPDLFDGQWHQVICRRTGAQIIETVDGTTWSYTQATGTIKNTDPIRFGSHENVGSGYTGSPDYYNGLLDEVEYMIG
jgi:hypothetical protein